MTVRIRNKLPKGDANGIASWETRLAKDPDTVVAVVALVRADAIEQQLHTDDDPQIVKCTVLALEALDGGPGDTVAKMLRDAYHQRTGRLTLPFEDDDDE